MMSTAVGGNAHGAGHGTTTAVRRQGSNVRTNDPPGISSARVVANPLYHVGSSPSKSRRGSNRSSLTGRLATLLNKISSLSLPEVALLTTFVGLLFFFLGRDYFHGWSSSSSSSGAALYYDEGPPADLVVHGRRKKYQAVPEEYRKRAYVSLKKDSHFPRAFRSQGWETFNEDEDYKSGTHHILYARHTANIGKRSAFTIPKPWQRLNHLPGMGLMEAKDTFLNGFQDYEKHFQKVLKKANTKHHRHDTYNPIYMIPETYNLETEEGRSNFQKTLDHDQSIGRHRPWVLKKANVNNGKGVEMIPPASKALDTAVDRAQADDDNNYVIQAYICNELTWFGGEKFDLRFYWLVVSVDPLIVLYHDGYARVSGAQYDETNFDSTAQHLTNHAYRGNAGDEDVLADALWRRVREYYAANRSRLSKLLPPSVNGDPVKHIRNQLKEAISTTAAAFRHTTGFATEEYAKGNKYDYIQPENLFALYGADFIIDQDLDVFYVEGTFVFFFFWLLRKHVVAFLVGFVASIFFSASILSLTNPLLHSLFFFLQPKLVLG